MIYSGSQKPVSSESLQMTNVYQEQSERPINPGLIDEKASPMEELRIHRRFSPEFEGRQKGMTQDFPERIITEVEQQRFGSVNDLPEGAGQPRRLTGSTAQEKRAGKLEKLGFEAKHRILDYLGAQGDVKLLEESAEIVEEASLEEFGLDFLVFDKADQALAKGGPSSQMQTTGPGDIPNQDRLGKYNEQRKVFLVRLRRVRNLCIGISAFLFVDSLKFVTHAAEDEHEGHNPFEDLGFMIQLVMSFISLTFFLLTIRYEAKLVKFVHIVMVVVILQQIALQQMQSILQKHQRITEERHAEEGEGHSDDHDDGHRFLSEDEHHEAGHDDHNDHGEEARSSSLANILIQLMQYTVLVTIAVYLLMFYNHPYVKYIAPVLVVLNALVLLSSQNDPDDPLKQSEIFLLSVWTLGCNLFLLGCLKFFLSIATETYSHVKKMADYREDFKIIFENLEESLLIISNESIDYVNDYFLLLFKGFFKEKVCTREFNSSQGEDEDSAGHLPSGGSAFLQQTMLKEYREGSSADDESEDFHLFQTFSVSQLTRMDPGELRDMNFVLMDDNYVAQHKERTSDFSDNLIYLKVKLTQFRRKGFLKQILQFIDISNDIRQSQYKAQNELLSMINACVSHELRNPLNSIVAQNIEKISLYQRLESKVLGLKQHLYSQTRISPGTRSTFKFFQEILQQLQQGHRIQESSSDLMLFMVQDLLDFAQIKADKFRKQLTRFDIRESIESVMCIQRKKAQDQALAFVAHFENIADLSPEETEEHFREDYELKKVQVAGKEVFSPIIYSDESRIKQVLLGLQSNALKFTQKGSVEILARIRETDGQVFLDISIRDTGIGIKIEDQGKLFKLFGFVQDAKQLNTKGIGLGLVIAENIVSQYGGKIMFKSVPGKGSTFTFSFELQDSSTPRSADSSQPEIVNTTTLKFKWRPQQADKSNRFGTVFKTKSVGAISEKSDAFSMTSYGPDIKYVGDLNCLGTSPKKKRESIYFEEEKEVRQQEEDFQTTPLFFSKPKSAFQKETDTVDFSESLSLPSEANEIVVPSEVPKPLKTELEEGLTCVSRADSESSYWSGFFPTARKAPFNMNKILIVDDQSFNIDALKIIMKHRLGLADADSIIEVALGGQQAIDIITQDALSHEFAKSSFVLILMDCNMPFVDGYQATQEIRQFLYNNKIVQPVISAVTGHSDQNYAEKALSSGMNQVLSKPAPVDILKDLLLKLNFQFSPLPE